jgi:hypothetical protein
MQFTEDELRAIVDGAGSTPVELALAEQVIRHRRTISIQGNRITRLRNGSTESQRQALVDKLTAAQAKAGRPTLQLEQAERQIRDLRLELDRARRELAAARSAPFTPPPLEARHA